MNILIISYYFPPIRSVASERIYCFAKYLSEAGHHVEVLTTSPLDGKSIQLPDVKIIRLESRLKFWIEQKFAFLRSNDGKRSHLKGTSHNIFHRIFTRINDFRVQRGLGYLGRMPDVTDLWYLTCKKWIRKQPGWDLVISSYAPYSSLLAAKFAINKDKSKYWIADFRDPWTEHHLFPALFPFTVIEKSIEKSIFRQASLITTVSSAWANRFASRFPNSKVTVIYNGYRSINAKPNRIPALPSEALNILYTGSIYSKIQDIEPLFAALYQLQQTQPKGGISISLNFCGSSCEYIHGLAEKYQVTNLVNHFGLVTYETARSYMLEADLLLLIDSNFEHFDGILPVKMYDYMASARPILFLESVVSSEAKEIIQNSGAGLFVKNSCESILNFLLEANRNHGLPIADIDYKFIEQYSRKSQCEKLIDTISKLATITNSND